jgi:hypothetical protein
MRRVIETTQMVVDVLSPAGLGPAGHGLRTVQKVRLIHAMNRHLLTANPQRPWNAEWGVPINQEDLAGTLMEFSFVVLDGLSRLGIELEAEDKDAYVHIWANIGKALGLVDELLPSSFEDAKSLARLIRERQIAPSAEGRAMAAALVSGFKSMLPWYAGAVVPAALRFFLRSDPFDGRDIAELLDIRAERTVERLVDSAFALSRLVERWTRRERHSRLLREWSRHYVRGLLRQNLAGARATFAIPSTLMDAWGVSSPVARPR